MAKTESRILRTKEQFIAAQKPIRDEGASDRAAILARAAARMLKDNHLPGVLDVLPQVAALLWVEDAFGCFDLRRVDERGFLLDGGERGCLDVTTGQDRQVVTWNAGEHLDDVLDRGAKVIEERARQALDGARETVTWDDVRSWLVAIGFEDQSNNIQIAANRGDGMDSVAFTWPLGSSSAPPAAFFTMIGELIGLPVRDVHDAIRRRAIVIDAVCPDPLESIVCRCGPNRSRTVPKSEAFATSEGWKCAVCAASEAHDALQKIAHALDLPAGGDVTKVVPEAFFNAWTALQAIAPAVVAGFQAAAPLLSPEQRAGFERIAEDGLRAIAAVRLDRDALVSAASRIREAADRTAQEGLNAIAADFGTEPTKLEDLRRRPVLAVQGANASDELRKKLLACDPERFKRLAHGDWNGLPTFANVRARWRSARIVVVEPDLAKRHALIEHLVNLGGAAGKNPYRVYFDGGMRVDIGAEWQEVADLSTDVAVGLERSRAEDLLQASEIGLAVAAEDAPVFWGMRTS